RATKKRLSTTANTDALVAVGSDFYIDAYIIWVDCDLRAGWTQGDWSRSRKQCVGVRTIPDVLILQSDRDPPRDAVVKAGPDQATPVSAPSGKCRPISRIENG